MPYITINNIICDALYKNKQYNGIYFQPAFVFWMVLLLILWQYFAKHQWQVILGAGDRYWNHRQSEYYWNGNLEFHLRCACTFKACWTLLKNNNF